MQILDLLKQIQPVWLKRIVQNMAHGAGQREDFREQLTHFYALLSQVVETGDEAWLDSIVLLWATSLPLSDLEGKQTNLTHLLREMMIITIDVARNNLSEAEALDIITALAPCFAYTFEKASVYEMEARINTVSNQLESAQQSLERLERSKSDFIAVAAHELRTPLTLVDGYTAMLRESLANKEQEGTFQQLLEGIDHGTRRLQVIIDNMIDVSMIDNNLLQLNFQPVWVNRLFAALDNELSHSLKERQQKLLINPFSGWNELTFGDPERLMQVFRNVLINAIKFTPDRGSINITGRKLPGFLEVTVTDSGIGIDIEDQQVIFEKFGQVGNISLHSSGKTKFKGGGPGLGLPIAKGIIEAHGGAIWVESVGFNETCCPGSTFHILLPLRSTPPDDRAAKLFAALIDGQHLNANH